jgi:mannose-6-phosphate isomerase-like protein (cupin superfamily)
MHHLIFEPRSGFHVLAGSRRSQAASMVLAPGTSTGGPNNQHPASDQWLYVLAGEGDATVKGKNVTLRAGSLLLIEAGETHEIRSTGDQPLETLNIYAPPAY